MHAFQLSHFYRHIITHALIGEEFEEEKKDTYLYETLGGNHSRAALQALCEEMENPPAAFRTRLVSVYCGLSNEEAYRLASKHNNATSLQNKMTHWEKVKLFFANMNSFLYYFSSCEYVDSLLSKRIVSTDQYAIWRGNS